MRLFNPSIGIDEDRAIGMAASSLADYMKKLVYIEKDQNYWKLQGEYVNQPSIIHVNVAYDGVWVSGSSVIAMEGKLYCKNGRSALFIHDQIQIFN